RARRSEKGRTCRSGHCTSNARSNNAAAFTDRCPLPTLSATWLLRLLEARLKPDLLVQVVLDCGCVLVGRCGMPASAEPSSNAAPRVTRAVLAAPPHVVEPSLPTLEADAPDRVGGIRVHRGGRGDSWPGAALVRIAVLHEAEALRAQPWFAVRAEAMARRASARIRSPVAQAGLAPPALLCSLSIDQVFVYTPLAGGPAQDLLRRASEGSVYSGADLCVGAGVITRRKEVGRQALARRLVCRGVEPLVLGRRSGQSPDRALRTGRQRGARRHCSKVTRCRRRGRCRPLGRCRGHAGSAGSCWWMRGRRHQRVCGWPDTDRQLGGDGICARLDSPPRRQLGGAGAPREQAAGRRDGDDSDHYPQSGWP